MIDDLARALDRGVADAPDPPDRISVRDHVREVEIGAFKSERGVTQRIRFNVVLEVGRHAAAVSDDVDQVISYDMIVEAIDAVLAAGRINLLETCAERLAEKCLADPRTVRALVRVEKLDRIPGALGVEIVRSRLPDDVRKVSAVEPGAAEAPGPAPVVLVVPPDAGGPAAGATWRRAVAEHAGPIIVIAAPGGLLGSARARAAELELPPVAARRLELLAFDQAAWAFAGAGESLSVAETRTELRHAARTGAPAVWAPFKLLDETFAAGSDVGDVAAALVAELGAEKLVVAGDAAVGDGGGAEVLRISGPDKFPRGRAESSRGTSG